MTWAAIIAMILQILGPLLKEWLDRLLQQAARRLDGRDLPPGVVDPVRGMQMVFDEARSQLWFWQWNKHWALDRVEQMMLSKARPTWAAAAKNGPPPLLTFGDAAAVGELPD